MLIAALLAMGAATSATAYVAPQLDADSSGAVSFTWQTFREDVNAVIQARRRAFDGTLGNTETLSEDGLAPARPKIAVDPSGNAVIAYTFYDGTNTLIHARRMQANGTVGPVKVLSPLGEDADQPQLDVDRNGRATIVWRNFSDPNDTSVEGRRMSAAGALGAVIPVSAAGELAEKPQVAVDSPGHATVVWRGTSGANRVIRVRRWAADGALSTIRDLSEQGENADDPNLALDAGGSAFAVWTRNVGVASEPGVQIRRRTPDGTLSKVLTLSKLGQRTNTPRVAADPTGRATVVWEAFDGSNWVIQARRRWPGGDPGGLVDISPAGSAAEEPRVAVDRPGDALVVWVETQGANAVVRLRRFTVGGAVGGVQSLSTAGAPAGGGELMVHQDGPAPGTATFVWHRNFVIQTRQRTPAGTLTPVQDLTN